MVMLGDEDIRSQNEVEADRGRRFRLHNPSPACVPRLTFSQYPHFTSLTTSLEQRHNDIDKPINQPSRWGASFATNVKVRLRSVRTGSISHPFNSPSMAC